MNVLEVEMFLWTGYGTKSVQNEIQIYAELQYHLSNGYQTKISMKQ